MTALNPLSVGATVCEHGNPGWCLTCETAKLPRGPHGFIEPTFIRTARKEHRCEARPCMKTERVIRVGERYAEYVGEVAGYQSGSRYHLGPCAEQQLGGP